MFPAGGSVPNASIVNYSLENIANATTVPLGTMATPTAAAGNLCLYEATTQNRTFVCIANVSGSYMCGTNPFGAAVVVTATAAGRVFSYGSWAVTAP